MFKPDVEAALRKSVGIIIPLGNQELDGSVQVNLGSKGIVELELVSSGAKWGRGPTLDVHSSYEAQIDSPAWHLVQALNTLVKADGHTPAVEGFFDNVASAQPAAARDPRAGDSAPQRSRDQEGVERVAMVTATSRGTTRWCGWCRSRPSTSRVWSAGIPVPGGKTILPQRAAAKIDMRLVPDMTAKEHAGAAQETPRQARLRRRRGEHDRRLRPRPRRRRTRGW